MKKITIVSLLVGMALTALPMMADCHEEPSQTHQSQLLPADAPFLGPMKLLASLDVVKPTTSGTVAILSLEVADGEKNDLHQLGSYHEKEYFVCQCDCGIWPCHCHDGGFPPEE